MKSKRTLKWLIPVAVLVLLFGAAVIGISATSPVDAMTDIESELSQYLITEPTRVDDGYIGIPIEYSVYYDKANGKARPDFIRNGGTPVVMYIVNTMAERVGTESDVSIIRSMLDRGYVVFIMDYLNSPKASGHDLEWSIQNFRRSVVTGGYVSGTEYIPKGNYKENFVAPAGCNVSLNHVFWEADKHGADGTIDKIVEIWNNDFRATNADVVIKWTYEDGTRKTTATGIDGSSPVWYKDADGKTVDTDGTGEYIKVKHTWANDIYDCTERDGRGVDLNLYMHIVYPTSPETARPVTALANSSTFPTTQKTSADTRPHSVGFSLQGYVNLVFDYLWVPMAREASYGYFDGQKTGGGVTGDQMNYSLHIYNDKKINTAAMRYIRYIANENEEFSFDTDAIGVYGNSKGGWFTFLGDEELHDATDIIPGLSLEESMDARFTAYTSKRQFPHHADETRYQAGKTESETKHGITIDGGELQPWLTYDSNELKGREIPSYATVLYACCGPAYEDMDVGHAPMFISSNLYDEYKSAWGSSNLRANLARALDLPSLVCESAVGHMLTHSADYTYGFDTYEAFFDFFGYYLRGDSVKVVYTAPANGGGDISVTDSFLIKFIGSVARDEIERVTFADQHGNTVSGTWSALYGNTEWTFTPDHALSFATVYTVTVPGDLAGDNGTVLGEEYKTSFRTERGSASTLTVDGLYVTATVPEVNGDEYELRFKVGTDAANVVSVLLVSGKGATDGTVIKTVNLSGKGYYSVDVSEIIYSANAGDKLTFLIKPENEAKSSEIFRDEFTSVNSSGKTPLGTTFGNYVRSADSVYEKGEKLEAAIAPGGADAIKFVMGMNGSRYPNIEGYPVDNEFYARTTASVFHTSIFGSEPLSERDYGRRFEITIRVFDTTSRTIYAYVESMTGVHLDNAYSTMDYNIALNNFTTKANEWCEFTLYYTVYDSDFGKVSEYTKKELYYEFSPAGYMENGERVDCPVYVDYLSVREITTDTPIDEAALVSVSSARPYKKSEGGFVLSSGGSYETLGAALAAAKDGDTVTMKRNYTLTDAESTAYLASFGSITLDLGGYRLTSLARNTSPVHICATAAADKSVITVKNGSVYTKYTSLITFGGSSSAGAGREFDVNFNNVYFGIVGTAFATEMMAESTLPTGALLSVNVRYNGCEIYYPNSALSRVEGVIFPTGTDKLSLNYEFIGGSITLTNERWLNISDSLKALSLCGTALVLPADAIKENSGYMTDLGVAYYVPSQTDGYITTYVAECGALSTKYGIIPEKYADEELYPFIVFDDAGEFFGSYDSFDGLMDCFLNRRDGRSWYTVMRRDVIHNVKVDNLSMGVGTYYIDLLGNTITCDGVMLFNADSKTNGDVAVNMLNGNVEVDNLGMIRLLGWATSKYDTSNIKHFDFSFNKVNISLADGATATDLVTYYYERGASSAGPAYNDLTFTDCTFDVRGAGGNITVFNVGAKNGGAHLVADLNVYGCEIIADGTEGVTVYKLTAGTESSVAFSEGEGGYLKYTVPQASAVPSVTLPDSGGRSLVFAKASESGSTVTYQLTEDNLNTVYGKISEEFASREDYPFAVFDGKGNFITATSSFTVTAAAAASASGDGAVILMRRNADIKNNKAGSNSFNLEGKVTVDLGGYTLSMSDSGADAFIRLQPTVLGRSTTVEVKNGTILMGNDPVARFAAVNSKLTEEYKAGAHTDPHKLTAIFTGITFEMDNTASSHKYLLLYTYGDVDVNDDNTIIFDGCSINTQSFVPEYGIVASHKTVGVKVHFIGGELKSALTDLTSYKLDSLNASGGSSIDFARDAGGNMLTLRTPLDATGIPAKAYVDASLPTEATLTFTEFARDSVFKTYMLSAPTLETPYGKIDPQYASVLDYPIAVFKKDGTFVGCYNNWGTSTSPQGGALHYAKNAGDGAVVYLRADFVYNTRQYDNLGQQKGTLYIDLGGHKLIDESTHNYGLFYSTKKVTYDTTVIITNGTIELTKNPLIRVYANTSAGGNRAFNLIFRGVDVVCREGTSVSSVIISDITTTSTLATTTNITFEDCTFDLRYAKSGAVLANASLTKYIGSVNVYINGGKIVTGSGSIVYTNVEEGSSVTFGKGTDGKYTTFLYPEGKAADTAAFSTTAGDYYLTRMATEGGYDSYSLRPKTLSELTVKTNVTLYSDFIFNVYVPQKAGIEKIELGGVTYKLDELREIELDGAQYYHVPVYLASYEAARNLVLRVSVTAGKDEFVGSWTFDIVRYASLVLLDDPTVAEAALVKDMLAYVKAAYAYFAERGEASEADAGLVASRVNELIGEDYEQQRVVEVKGDTALLTPGLKGATVKVGACVAFVFYPTENAADYEFYVGGKRAPATVIEGEEPCIIVTTYAYSIGDVVSYNVKGTDISGEYSLKCYYDYTCGEGEGSAALIALVERLYAYGESAAIYRNEVLEG